MADSPSKQIADLVKDYRDAHPGVSIDACFAAVREAEPKLWAQYALERGGATPMTTTPPAVSAPGDGVAAVGRIGSAMPKDGQPLAASDAPHRWAQAVDRIMTEKALTGTKGREQAQHLLAEMEPELAQQYADSLTVRL